MKETAHPAAERDPDLRALADALFGVSGLFLRRQRAFLPHGAVLTRAGEVRMVAAAPDDPQQLPDAAQARALLREALLRQVALVAPRAVALCEDVSLAGEAGRSTRAIRVLVEHEAGHCVAAYLPFRRRLLGGLATGAPFYRHAAAELGPWASQAPASAPDKRET